MQLTSCLCALDASRPAGCPPAASPPAACPPAACPPVACPPAACPPVACPPVACSPWPRARGSVTAETAVLLPVLLVVLAAAIGVLACVAAQLRCVDAARGAARAAARGDDPSVVRSTGQRLAPPGARVVQSAAGDTVEIVVTAQVRPFGAALGLLPAVAVSGRAVAAVEDRP